MSNLDFCFAAWSVATTGKFIWLRSLLTPLCGTFFGGCASELQPTQNLEALKFCRSFVLLSDQITNSLSVEYPVGSIHLLNICLFNIWYLIFKIVNSWVKTFIELKFSISRILNVEDNAKSIYLQIGVVLSTLSINSYHFFFISSKMTHLPIEIIVLTYIPWISIFSNQRGTSFGPNNPLLKKVSTLESLPWKKNPSTPIKLGLYLVAQPINSKPTFE